MAKLYILLLLLLASAGVHAQRLYLNGYLLDSITHLPIAGGTLTNTATKTSVRSSDKGFFRLEAAPNDVIYAQASAYHIDTLQFSFLYTDTATIYLAPSGDILPNIIVTAQYNKYQLDSMERRTAFIENAGPAMPVVGPNNNGAFGVGINLDRVFKKKNKDHKKEEADFTALEKQAYIDYRFSPQLVAYYTGLRGDALSGFMYRYTPSYNWLRQHPTNELVLLYINEQLKAYKKNPVKKSF